MKYVFPCIITKEQELYEIVFPDFESRSVCGVDLYDTLKSAHNILLLDLYIKEAQRIVIGEPTPIEKIRLAANQSTSYVICDTDVFSNMLDFYDNIEIDDLEAFLNKKVEVTLNNTTLDVTTNNEPIKTTDDAEEESPSTSKEVDSNELFGFEDDLEVVNNNPEQSQVDTTADSDIDNAASESSEDSETSLKSCPIEVESDNKKMLQDNDLPKTMQHTGEHSEKSSKKPIKHYNNYRRKPKKNTSPKAEQE